MYSSSAGQIKNTEQATIFVSVWSFFFTMPDMSCDKDFNIAQTLALTLAWFDLSHNLHCTFSFLSSCSFHGLFWSKTPGGKKHLGSKTVEKKKKTLLFCDAKELPNWTIDKTLLSSGRRREFTQPLEVLWLTRTIVLKKPGTVCVFCPRYLKWATQRASPSPVGMEQTDSEMKCGRSGRDGD